MIGSPNEDQKSFVTDSKALEYLESFPKSSKADFRYKYPGAPSEAIDFLDKILVFNPYFRMSLQEALEHPVFNKVRKPQNESFIGNPIELEFEKLKLDKPKLRELILKEISYYHQL